VRVRAADGVRCRAESAGATRRVPQTAGDALEIPNERFLLDQTGRNWIEPAGAGYRLSLPDVVGERSQLYYPPALERRGRYRIVVDGRREREQRTVALRPPPFARQARGADPRGELLWRLLERGEPPFRAADATERAERFRARLTPGWMHGQAWLEWRDVIAAALARDAGYRRFAHDLLAEEDRRSKEALVGEALRLGEIDTTEAGALRAALAGLAFEPARRGVTARLGAWLGDVTARDWTAELERWSANRLLAGEPGAAARIERLETRWSELAAWFPPPTTVRVLTPLTPALDETRGAVGFYRVLLPTVEDRGPPRDAVPSAPHGLRELRRLVADGAVVSGDRVEAIRYRTLQGAEARRARRAFGADRDRRMVSVQLSLRAADGSPREHETVRIDGAR
jgi:hypothetical protein